MSDYQKNIEVMAHSLALMLAPIVVLSEDDSLNVYMLDVDVCEKVAKKLREEYINEIEIDPVSVRALGLGETYRDALIQEFDSFISDSCEQWIRRIQKDDKGE